mmetsp:Transcript_15320/g.28846  ORF Transcript_15320/g.28846 Transcript_15320/m.28846 type:complete len:847 (+) Transcript_15320:1213-3753(+)|eukprot:CAMPEP_0176489148 /NCGR_PEP_ID=MMETSP0200_2-20121128/7122_1 /TAXON_ID=947934 /ORGANISM="Chaetoceros sp., Strain GSL56" /LENGTH=846 /DNA_ID=CAMNT_0017886247 /DNA_START=1162 /DNA_END=3702 /DNA_ORIENTATION=+
MNIEETFSPLPPPPPPQEQQNTICIRNILDEYYDAGSFGSNSSSGVVRYMNAADFILEEMNRISPPKNIEGHLVRRLSGDDDNRYASQYQSHHEVEGNRMNEHQCPEMDDDQQQKQYTYQNDMLESNDKIMETYKETDTNNTSKPTSGFQNVSESLTNNIQKVADSESNTGQFAAPIPKVPDEQKNSGKPKRSFLRKGTRKEPSALHRISKTSLSNSQQNLQLSDSKEKRKSLEPLERMQEKHMEDLQKRINRRLEARDDIRKRKQGCKIQVVGRINEEVDNKGIATAASNEITVADESYDSVTSNDSQSKSDISSDMSYQAIGTQDGNCRNKVLSSPPPTNCLKSESRSKCHPKKQETNKCSSSEIEEQWQLIKSMRRRQEAALRAAEKEREVTKAWAAGEKEKLNKWKDNQRSLIQKERQRASNSLMLNERMKRQGKLEEQAAEASQLSYRKVREEIESLKELLKKQKIETDTVKSRHRLREKRWKDMIAERDKQILSLNEEMQKISKVNDDLTEEKANLAQKLEQMAKEKKKRKKKSISVGEDHRNIQESSGKENAMSQNYVKGNHYDDGGRDKDDCKKSSQDNGPNTGKVDETMRMDTATEGLIDEPTSDEPDSLNNHCDQNHHDIENDKDLARIIISHKDLLENPTEEWLRCHLDVLQCKSNGKPREEYGLISDTCELDHPVSNFFTPLKERVYDPSKYAVTVKKSSNNDKRNSKVKEEKLLNGTKIVTFHNGTVKETLPDGTIIVRFTNGDVKTSYGNIGITVYFYSDSKTSHTTHPDGTEVFEFASGQSEKHMPDGSKEVRFPDGTVQRFFINGGSELTYPNGVRVLEEESGVKHIVQF